MRFHQTTVALCAALTAFAATNVRAEATEITVAQQYGVSFLPLMVMQKQSLVEKHAAKFGLPGVTVKWAKVAGPGVMNDGLISGALQDRLDQAGPRVDQRSVLPRGGRQRRLSAQTI